MRSNDYGLLTPPGDPADLGQNETPAAAAHASSAPARNRKRRAADGGLEAGEMSHRGMPGASSSTADRPPAVRHPAAKRARSTSGVGGGVVSPRDAPARSAHGSHVASPFEKMFPFGGQSHGTESEQERQAWQQLMNMKHEYSVFAQIAREAESIMLARETMQQRQHAQDQHSRQNALEEVVDVVSLDVEHDDGGDDDGDLRSDDHRLPPGGGGDEQDARQGSFSAALLPRYRLPKLPEGSPPGLPTHADIAQEIGPQRPFSPDVTDAASLLVQMPLLPPSSHQTQPVALQRSDHGHGDKTRDYLPVAPETGRPQHFDANTICTHCGRSDTPQWRKGWLLADGTRCPLCNACGLKHHKKHFCPLCNGLLIGIGADKSQPVAGCASCKRHVHTRCERRVRNLSPIPLKSPSSRTATSPGYYCPDCS